jgi:GNAT superfamily N-acetyltransferase
MNAHDRGPSPSWVAARVARPVRDLARSANFYGGLLELRPKGGFTGHAGYDGLFFALPGGGELEVTKGPITPRPGTDDDLLVLYLRTPEEVRRTVAVLLSADVPALPAANPYWDQWGRTFLDPDGYAVVIAAAEPDPMAAVRIETYDGNRDELRPLFELAEDSPSELDSYLDAGRVLVARSGEHVIGHLQLIGTEQQRGAEIKNMAVYEHSRRRGVGALLVQAAVQLVTAQRGSSLVVATAAADVGNLRFYQRQGFRMRSIQRDAFPPAMGYPHGILLDGIELRDRVWLDRPLTTGS